MKKLPSAVTINLKTGKSTTEFVELTDEEYEKRIIQPFARWLCERMKQDIRTGKFKPNEASFE